MQILLLQLTCVWHLEPSALPPANAGPETPMAATKINAREKDAFIGIPLGRLPIPPPAGEGFSGIAANYKRKGV